MLKFYHKKFVDFLQIIESYIDDVFGGALSKVNAADLNAHLIEVGMVTTAVNNPLKIRGVAKVMVFVDLQYE